MTVFPDTQSVALEDPRRRPARESFLSQTPLALVAIVAVAAIVAVNRADMRSARPAPAAAAHPVATASGCADCGEVVAIAPLPAAAGGTSGSAQRYALHVRMDDGTLRTVEQPSPGFAVGDRVRVKGNALTTGR
jgi:hypothetical protein